MIAFLKANIGTIIVAAIVIVLVVLCIKSLKKDSKSGGCAGCNGCNGCATGEGCANCDIAQTESADPPKEE